MRKLLLLILLGCIGFCSMAFALDQDEPLPADEAFQFAAELRDVKTVSLSWHIADGYYLYKQKFKFLPQTPGIDVEQVIFPAVQIKQDEVFGAVEIYRDTLDLTLPLRYSQQKPASLALELTYQGCADSGFCYMPIKKILTFGLDH